MTPVEELRAAADKLRTLTKAIDAPDLRDQAWHTEACANEETGDCPCIVAQGEYREFDQPQIPPVRYIADAETPELAAYIAAMGPPVSLALADWLDYEADLMGPGSERRGRTEHALAVTRAINGGAPR